MIGAEARWTRNPGSAAASFSPAARRRASAALVEGTRDRRRPRHPRRGAVAGGRGQRPDACCAGRRLSVLHRRRGGLRRSRGRPPHSQGRARPRREGGRRRHLHRSPARRRLRHGRALVHAGPVAARARRRRATRRRYDAGAALPRGDQGDRRPLPREVRRQDLSPSFGRTEQDEVIGGLEKGDVKLDGVECQDLLRVLLQNTIEGFFSDPIYGGNRDMVGWKLIGFPGARYDYRALRQQARRAVRAAAGRPQGPARTGRRKS